MPAVFDSVIVFSLSADKDQFGLEIKIMLQGVLFSVELNFSTVQMLATAVFY